MAISLIVVGALATLTAISTFSLTRGVISSGGLIGGTHLLGSADLVRPTLLDSLGSAMFSPFTSVISFLVEYLFTPLILIGFLILFIWAQYWLIKAYFGLGKHLMEFIHKLIVKFHLQEKGNEILTHLKKMSFHH